MKLTREALIEHLKKGTGTENGMSRFRAVAECARKARLDAASKAEGAEEGPSLSRDVGTLFHYFASLYHGGQPFVLPENEDEGWPVDEFTATFVEARRIFEDYTTRVSPTGLGTVVSTEELFTLPLAGCGEEITGRADLIVEVEVGRPLSEVVSVAAQMEPGIYLVDFKTHSSKPSSAHITDAWSLQALAYGEHMRRKYGDRYKGMIFLHIVRHKKLTDGSYMTTLVPPPQEADVKQLEGFINWTKDLAREDKPNLLNCVSWNRPCPHRLSGACSLI